MALFVGCKCIEQFVNIYFGVGRDEHSNKHWLLGNEEFNGILVGLFFSIMVFVRESEKIGIIKGAMQGFDKMIVTRTTG